MGTALGRCRHGACFLMDQPAVSPRCVMEFRWPAFIALWTLIVAPILAGPSGSRSASHKPAVTAAGKPTKMIATQNVRQAR
jgi:hypothetical protein